MSSCRGTAIPKTMHRSLLRSPIRDRESHTPLFGMILKTYYKTAVINYHSVALTQKIHEQNRIEVPPEAFHIWKREGWQGGIEDQKRKDRCLICGI